MIASIVLALMLTITPTKTFTQSVASKCAGESRATIGACACTVKNRLNRGFTKRTVLSAYYARNLRVSASEVLTVSNVLSGVTYCDPRWYFLFGTADVYYLGIQNIPPLARIHDTWIYEYWYRKRK